MNKREHTLSQIRALREVAKSMGRRTPRRTRLPRQLQPDLIRMEYLKGIKDLVLYPMWALVENYLTPDLADLVQRALVERGDSIRWYGEFFERDESKLRADATALSVRDTIAKIAQRLNDRASPKRLEQLAAKMGKRTSEFQREQLRKQIKAAVAVDPLMSEAGIVARVEAFTHQNVALIQTVPQKFFSEIEQGVMTGVRQGKRAAEIAQDLEDRFGVAESNAQRIANDQVGKFFGELNRVRQTQLGIDGYIWRGMLDNRERPEHFEREGKRFSWDDPPEGGHPSEEVNCRCWSEPDLTELLSEL